MRSDGDFFEDKHDYEIWLTVFSRNVKKKTKHPGMPHCPFFSPEKLALLPLLEDVKPPPNHKMIKLFKHLITCFRHYDILAKTCKTSSRMTTAIAFCRQNDAGSRARTTWYWENLVLEVFLVSESKVRNIWGEGEGVSLILVSKLWGNVPLLRVWALSIIVIIILLQIPSRSMPALSTGLPNLRVRFVVA